MTVEEMRRAIMNKCDNTDYDECCLCSLYKNEGDCWEDSVTDEQIKRNV